MKKKRTFSDFQFKKIDLKKDKDLLLRLECELNYANESHLGKKYDFTEYERRWRSGGRPRRVLKAFRDALKDKKAICEFLEDAAGEKAAFFMVSFSAIKGFDCLTAFLEDIYVFEEYRKKGVGSFVLKNIEARAKKAGAKYINLGTSAFNVPARRLYESNKYYVYRHGYEKKL